MLSHPLRSFQSMVLAHPVGDGNAIELIKFGSGMMDCGGDSRAEQVLLGASARGMRSFLLTHPHADHYSGVLSASKTKTLRQDVTQLFVPAIPFLGTRSITISFTAALYTMNALLGEGSGVPEEDLANAFKKLNPSGIQPAVRFLRQGDGFNMAGISFEVLWPPPDASDLAKSAAAAVRIFQDAIQGQPEAKRIYENLRKHADDRIHEREQTTESLLLSSGEEFEVGEAGTQQCIPESDRLSEQLQEANKAIQSVANRLSLALRSGCELLHLGDLEAGELRKVANGLRGQNVYRVLVAAHHGTHWSKKLAALRFQDCLVSNGPKMSSFYKKEYDQARFVQKTHAHGVGIGLF